MIDIKKIKTAWSSRHLYTLSISLIISMILVSLQSAVATKEEQNDRLGQGDIVHYAIKPNLKGIVLFGYCAQVWSCEYEVRFVSSENNLYIVKGLSRFELVKE